MWTKVVLQGRSADSLEQNITHRLVCRYELRSYTLHSNKTHVCTLTFRNLASYIQDGRKITLQMPHFIFIQQISVLNILNKLYNLHFFSSKCRLFHNAILFGFCITHILNTGCAKIWKKKSVAKRLIPLMLSCLSDGQRCSKHWKTKADVCTVVYS